MGSTRIARRAGNQLAARAALSNTTAETERVAGSVGPIPNRNLERRLRTAKHPARPIMTPRAARRNARAVIMRKIVPECAPSATRIAIPARLLVTAYERTPYSPTTARTSARNSEPAQHLHLKSLPRQGPPEYFIHGFELHSRFAIGGANAFANRGHKRGRISCAA